MSLPQEGSKAPHFPEFNNYKGKNIVLYFYPKDDTPGCTVQACGFRDSFKEIEKLGAVVLGVSPDSAKSHDKFINKFQLPFPLISDEDKKICASYGVVARTTFIINKEGKIAKVFEKVKPEGHNQEILAALNSLK